MSDRTQCLVCGSKQIKQLLHLPALPLIPGCVDADSGECPRQDLDIMYCKNCGLMFNNSEVIQEVGLSPYPSSTIIKAKLEQDKDFAKYVKALSEPGHLLDVGCHDGHFLSLMRDSGWSVRGCEPSSYAQIARNDYGLEVDQALFSSDLYRGEQFDAITTRNVLCVVPNPIKLLQDCHDVLRSSGLLIVENINPEVWFSLESIAIGHQVRYYFNYADIQSIAEQAGFSRVDMHKGYRMYLAFRKNTEKPPAKTMVIVKGNGAAMEKYAANYQRYLKEIKDGLEELFNSWRKDKLSVCIFGAGNHTQFLLNILNLRDEDISCIVDSDPAKHGKVIAGSKIKILPPSAINEMKIDIVLVSSPALQDEIIDQLQKMDVNSRIVKIYPKPAYVQTY